MKPTTAIYRFLMADKGNLGDAFCLKRHSDNPTRFRPCDFGDETTGAIVLPWMTQKELVAWLRKAVDMIEGAKFEW